MSDLAKNIHWHMSRCCDELKLKGIANLLDIKIRVQKDMNRQK